MAEEPRGLRTCEELPTFSTEKKVKERFCKNFKAISECLNYEELVPLLCEGSEETAVLSIGESQSFLDSSVNRPDKAAQLSQKLESKSYSVLLDCLYKEEEHLGHSFICDLLEGRQHASEKDIIYSKTVKGAMKKKLTAFTKGLSPNELIPHMMEHKLLTTSEAEQLYGTTSSIKQNISLLRILDTKGPLGHSLFAKCLQNEDSHVTHGQLYDLIHKDMDYSLIPTRCSVKYVYEEIHVDSVTALCKRDPSRISLQGVLTGEEYDKIIYTFQTCQYNGAWAKMEAEASKYLKEGIPCELQVTALLEKAMGLIFRKQNDEPFRLISKARDKCKQVQGDNHTFLEGRCEYVLSVLYRYSKQYDKAKEHAENALRILFSVERGHDTAFACLIYAALLVVSGGSKTEAKHHLAAAISDAKSHSTGTNLVVPHSYMRLAQILIKSVHSSNGRVQDNDSIRTIREAEECLRNVDPASLSVRSRCRLHLTESSLFRCKEMRPQSKCAAENCLDLATRHHLTTEIEAARDVLSSF